MEQILTGLKVLDLTRLLPGPLCSMIMADYGADVIKIEDTTTGDPTRLYGPFINGESSFFRQLNRNKKSLAVNLKKPEGIEIFKQVVKESDVVLEGFRPGVMKRLGLSFEEISGINPRVIMASISGYGQDGPYVSRAGHDINYTAITGLLDLNRCGEDDPPEVSALQTADIGGGALMALAAVMMALFYRDRTGKGQYIDVSMADGLMPWLAYASSTFFAGADLPRSNGGEITGAYAFYNIYRTSDDKYMSLAAVEPVFWQRFCRFAEREDWEAKQFDLHEQDKLKKEIAVFFLGKKQEEWVNMLTSEDFCCEPVLSMAESPEHPQLKKRKFFIDVNLPGGKTTKQIGFPLRFSSDHGNYRMHPPGLGEHSRAILSEAGYSDEMISNYAEAGIILKV